MVTAEVNAVLKSKATYSFMGLSTDEKPVGEYGGFEINNGSSFFEMDTMKVIFYDGNLKAWLES